MSFSFIKNKEDFVCEQCGAEVVGNGYTNHCPRCLFSKHLDVNPGDRISGCGGLMIPINVILTRGEYTIEHKCLSCGEVRKNRAAPNDNIGEFLTPMV